MVSSGVLRKTLCKCYIYRGFGAIFAEKWPPLATFGHPEWPRSNIGAVMSACPTCGQTRRTAIDRRAARAAKASDFDTGRCRACQTPIVAGWLGGILVTLDPRPLSQTGALVARTTGTWIYQRRGTKFRDYPQMPQMQPHPDRPDTLHVKHECGRTWGPELFLTIAGQEETQ